MSEFYRPLSEQIFYMGVPKKVKERSRSKCAKLKVLAEFVDIADDILADINGGGSRDEIHFRLRDAALTAQELLGWHVTRFDLETLEDWQNRKTPNKRPERFLNQVMRGRILQRDGDKCQVCGATENLHIDHKLPVSKGGKDEEENLWVLCQPCNSSKGVKPLDDWLSTRSNRGAA